MNMFLRLGVTAVAALAATLAAAQQQTLRPGDHIAAIVNQELVTAFELNQRIGMARADAQRKNQRLPPEGEFRTMILESLIEDRALLSHALALVSYQ